MDSESEEFEANSIDSELDEYDTSVPGITYQIL
jgi:hypothetical protein